jgi:hypothetical protein
VGASVDNDDTGRYRLVTMDFETTVEVFPGVFRRLRDCHVDELAMAMECQVVRREARFEAEVLLAEAAERNLVITQELRDRLCEFQGDLPTVLALVDELRAACLQPA